MEKRNEEKQLEEIEALQLALADERVAHARHVLATHQRTLEMLVRALRQKYETDEMAVVGLDAGRGVVQLEAKSDV